MDKQYNIEDEELAEAIAELEQDYQREQEAKRIMNRWIRKNG
jgi:hypothetical protein